MTRATSRGMLVEALAHASSVGNQPGSQQAGAGEDSAGRCGTAGHDYANTLTLSAPGSAAASRPRDAPTPFVPNPSGRPYLPTTLGTASSPAVRRSTPAGVVTTRRIAFGQPDRPIWVTAPEPTGLGSMGGPDAGSKPPAAFAVVGSPRPRDPSSRSEKLRARSTSRRQRDPGKREQQANAPARIALARIRRLRPDLPLGPFDHAGEAT